MLQLDVGSPEVASIDDALTVFTRAEAVLGYRAEGSSQPSTADKSVRVLEPPPVLVLHLMR